MPLYGHMVEWLKIEKEIRDQNYPDCPFVFRRGSKPIKNFRKSWATACEAAGVPDLMPHDLRRTAAREMIRAGIQEKVVMQVCGWKTRVMFDRYNIVSEGDLRLFRARMNAHVGHDFYSDQNPAPKGPSQEGPDSRTTRTKTRTNQVLMPEERKKEKRLSRLN
jgi:hypothetical protein